MSDELLLNGKTYVSSKRAAEATGYARDYIGQLARGGQIDAERVGGLWYVSLESLEGYEKNAEVAKMIAPISSGSKEGDSGLSFEGKEYISASRAAKLTGYNQDYVGQLARGGKIPSRQIGNRWYVDSDALKRHKAEKDALLAAVQAESVGIKPLVIAENPVLIPMTPVQRVKEHVLVLPPMKYSTEERDLYPSIPEKKPSQQYPMSNFDAIKPIEHEETQNIAPESMPSPVTKVFTPTPARLQPIKRSKRRLATVSMGVLTIILVLSVGMISLSDASVFASIRSSGTVQSMSAGAAATIGRAGDIIENVVSPVLVYERGR